VKLLCSRCGHRGSADLSFIWYAKAFAAPTKAGERWVWLCPDCQLAFRNKRERDRFLQSQLARDDE